MTLGRRPDGVGASALETLAILGLLALLLVGASPILRRLLVRERIEMGAHALASEVRLQRGRAVASAIGRGIAFEQLPGGPWTVRLVRDGDDDGVRADDIRRGIDPTLEGPETFEKRYGGARLGFAASLTQIRSPPPVGDLILNLDDPVRLGSTNTISLSPRGTTTSGTLYLTDGTTRQWAVVLYGNTARLRIWEYDLRQHAWTPRF